MSYVPCLANPQALAFFLRQEGFGASKKFSTFSLRRSAGTCQNGESIGNWDLRTAVSDEFNEDAISRIWHLQGRDDGQGADLNNNRGRNAQFTPEAIRQRDGVLRITSEWDKQFEYASGFGNPPATTGALISKALLKSGYVEIRCRVGKSPMSAAFWAVGDDNRGAGCVRTRWTRMGCATRQCRPSQYHVEVHP